MEDKCYAPVFTANGFFACVILTIIYTLVIVLLIVATLGLILFSPKGRCIIKQYSYRMRYCREGNDDPNVLI